MSTVYSEGQPWPPPGPDIVPTTQGAMTAEQRALAEDKRHLDMVNLLAKYEVKRRHLAWMEDDILSAAYAGLCDAATKFDPSRGLAFATYAVPRIRGAILDFLRMEAPVGYRQRTGMRCDAVPKTRQISGLRDNALAASKHDSGQSHLGGLDFEVDPLANDHMKIAEWRDDLEHYARRAGTPQAADVIRLYYGETLTMKQIGQRLGISEARVSQVHTQAIGQLREAYGVRAVEGAA